MDLLGVTCYCCIVMYVLVHRNLINAKKDDKNLDKINYGDLVQFRDGNIIIAVLIPVTRKDEEICNNDFRDEGIQMVEQVNMLIEKVNADDNLLPGIKLGTIIINTCFSGPQTLSKLMFEVLHKYILSRQCQSTCLQKNQTRILAGVVGAQRSSVSLDMARILQVFHIPQVSYYSTSPELSDKDRYKYFFRTIPPDNLQALAMTEFIKQKGWNYISVAYQNDPYGISGHAELVQNFKKHNICIGATVLVEHKTNQEYYIRIVKELMAKPNANAVIIFGSASAALKIISATNHVGGAKNKFTWIASDGWAEYLPYEDADDALLETLNGSIGFKPKFVHYDDLDKKLEKIPLQKYQGQNSSLNPWWQYFISQRNNCSLQNETAESNKRFCSPHETIENFIHLDSSLEESMMVFVHSLQSLYQDICSDTYPEICDKMKNMSGTNILGEHLFEYMKNVSFKTDDDRIFKFDENQDAPSVYQILLYDMNRSKYNKNGWRSMKTYDASATENHNITWPANDVASVCSEPCLKGQARITAEQSCCWFCQSCTNRQFVLNETECVNCSHEMMPNADKDACIPIPVRKLEYDSEFTIGCLAVGVFGLFCTTFVTAIYVKFRHTPIVRASGMELCFVILFGIFLTLTNCFVITAPPTTFSCALSRIILALGPVFIYAGMLVKTFRVVFIFHSKSIMSVRTKAYLEPVPILFITLLVVFLQVVILISWLLLRKPENTVFYYENEAFSTCKHLINEEIFVGTAYPFLICIICTILATINRNAPTGFRETLFIGFAMYTTCVTWIAFLPLFFTHTSEIPKQLTTISVALSVSAITVLFCLFVPRCYTMLMYPEVNTSESVMASTGSFSTPKRQRQRAKSDGNGVVNNAFSESSAKHDAGRSNSA